MKRKKKEISEALSEELRPEVNEEEKAPLEEEAEDSDSENPEEKMEADIALFHELFPDVKGDQIPGEVWESVEGGQSLAAAYALYTIRQMRQEERIRKVNEENEKKAPPRIRHDGSQGEYFSPEAVKAMSRGEVRKHYDAILRSMESWN